MKKALKYLGSILFCNVYRLLKIFPNNDPVMGCMLPFARRDKLWQAVLFPIIAMASFDFITMKIGLWTIGTSLAYGLIALLFYYLFRGRKKIGLKKYAASSIAGVLIFDFFTGPVMTSALFRIPFMVSLVGQVPFTLMHLASATALTIALAPVLDPQIRASMSKDLNMLVQKARLAIEKQLLRA